MLPASLFADDFQTILDQARDPGARSLTLSPPPEDWGDQWIYFPMVDPFNNRLRAPRVRFDDPNFVDFQGGAVRGLKELGVGAIWLSSGPLHVLR